MSNKSAPTERQKSERARRIAMGIAVIQRPLRLIRNSTYSMEPDAKGVMRKVESTSTKLARRAAQKGNGARVNEIARGVL